MKDVEQCENGRFKNRERGCIFLTKEAAEQNQKAIDEANQRYQREPKVEYEDHKGRLPTVPR